MEIRVKKRPATDRIELERGSPRYRGGGLRRGNGGSEEFGSLSSGFVKGA
jgi:hypothetical protein